jgi:hypothetical protein
MQSLEPLEQWGVLPYFSYRSPSERAAREDKAWEAKILAKLEPEMAGRACLRRAVSTAYYALFHLPVSEATSTWARPELRSELGRFYTWFHSKGTCTPATSRIWNL